MTTYHHGDLRAAVLAAAGKMLERQGLAGVSVREAARRAGVSHNAPYRHFPDRQALLEALAAEGFERLDKALDGRSGRELGEAYVAFALRQPQRFRLMFSAAGRAHAERLHAKVGKMFDALGAEAGIVAAAAWSVVHGLAELALDGHLDPAIAAKVLSAVRFAAGAQRPA